MKSHKSTRSLQDEYNGDVLKGCRNIFIALLLTIAMILFCLLSCSDDEPENIQDKKTKVIITAPPIEPPIIEPPDPESEPIQLSLWTGASLKFYDGESIFPWKSGTTARAESRVYSHENILYYLDEYGGADSSQNLITVPDLIAVSPTDYFIYQHIDKETASGMGGLYKDYSRFYQGNNEVGFWATQQYVTDKICVIDGDLYARKVNKTWLAITGTKTGVKYVADNFVIHDYDGANHIASINGVTVSWSTNFMNGAKFWQESDGSYYSENGYIWDGSALSESISVMTDWRMGPFITGYTEGPVVIAAGTREENSETVLYWIECNSGWVVRQVTSTNQMTLHVRIYSGDGFRTTGLFYSDLLKPVIVGDYLYYIFDAQVYRYDFVSGLNAVFCSGVSEVWGY